MLHVLYLGHHHPVSILLLIWNWNFGLKKNLLESNLKSLREDYTNALLKCDAVDERIKFLENEAVIKVEADEVLKNNLFEKNVIISDLSIKIKQLS